MINRINSICSGYNTALYNRQPLYRGVPIAMDPSMMVNEMPLEETTLFQFLNDQLPEPAVVEQEIIATAESVAEVATEVLDSTLTKPAAKTGTSMVVRTISHPLNTVLTKNIFGGATLAAAWKETKANPMAGCGSVLAATCVENIAIFTFKEVIAKKLHENGTDKDKAEMYASLPAAVMGTIVSYPICTKAFLLQLHAGKGAQELEPKLSVVKNIARHCRGINPAILRNAASWSLGLTLGDKLDGVSKEYLGDNIYGTLAAKTSGWVVGCFIGSPFFHMSQEMRKHGGEKALTMVDVMKNKGLICSSDQKASAKEKVCLFVKNAPKFWKGFCKATPAVILTGISIVSGEILAQQYFSNEKN